MEHKQNKTARRSVRVSQAESADKIKIFVSFVCLPNGYKHFLCEINFEKKMELEPMSSFYSENYLLPSSQTDPVGDGDEIPEFENNFVLEKDINLEISQKVSDEIVHREERKKNIKCEACQETISNSRLVCPKLFFCKQLSLVVKVHVF